MARTHGKKKQRRQPESEAEAARRKERTRARREFRSRTRDVEVLADKLAYAGQRLGHALRDEMFVEHHDTSDVEREAEYAQLVLDSVRTDLRMAVHFLAEAARRRKVLAAPADT